ncbi:MAG TPA: lysylphosphatidylglycerol synthase transmembrane domain-containing protein [Solirubrobacteraceae bacterium]|nr:lysylphosphatidylglycerol synthase transmembrane domain-containing protein [Solirubrobacteraceae bacterium]
MTQVGDRLERAIEERADTEQEIERGEAAAPPRRRLVRMVFWLAVTGVSLYLVAPSLVDVLGSWEDLDQLSPAWLALMLALQTGALACLWALQYLAMRGPAFRAVVSSQLAGNALAKIAPGGGALGAALQYRMLVQAGLPGRQAMAGLTATNLLVFAAVLAMPVLAVPAILRGGVSRDLLEAAAIGIGVFVALFALGAVLIAYDGVLAWVGRVIQRVRNRVRRGSEPLRTLPDRLLRERNRIVGTLGPRWKRALAATSGRWALDYATLLAALAAVGSQPRPSLVLLAFCAAQILAQIPITPGGLGFVEAGLTAMLALAGVSAGAAVLATFAYRLFSYWLPLPVGLAAFGWHSRRYRAVASTET